MPDFVLLEVVKGITALAALGIVSWGVVAFARARVGRAVPAAMNPMILKPVEERLKQLEESTESIALQVERIAEGQRFVTKLLADGTHTKVS
ncbi:MAG: hypothetical protein ABI322_07225 [Gemmatimonadaceae bacterium]